MKGDKFGLVRANPKAKSTNFKKEPANWDAAIGTDTLSATVTNDIKAIKYNPSGTEMTLPFTTSIAAADFVSKLAEAIVAVTGAYEYNHKIAVTYSGSTLGVVHTGQSTFVALVDSADADVAFARS